MIRVKPDDDVLPAAIANIEHEQSVLAFFKPLLFALRLFGINLGPETITKVQLGSCMQFQIRNLPRFKCWIHKVYCCLTFATMLSVSIWFLYKTVTYKVLSLDWTIAYFTFTMHAVAVVMGFLGSFNFWNGRFQDWIRQFVNYGMEYGVTINTGRLYARRTYIIIIYCLILILSPILFTTSISNYSILKKHFSCFHGSLDYANYVIVYIDITCLYVVLQGVLSLPIPGTYILGLELDVVRDKFKSYSKTHARSTNSGTLPSRDVNADLSDMIEQHEAICSLLASFNECISYILFTSFLFSLPTSCLSFYAVIELIAFPGVTLLPSMLLAYSLVPSTALCVVGAMLNTKAHAPLQYLWQIRTERLSEKNMRDLLMFTTKLTNTSIGYTVFGFFTLSRSTVLTIFGTVITYFVVVVQFRPQSSPLSDDLISNLTRFLQSADG